MVRKTKEETEDTKTQILQSALDCFYEKGFSKTSFGDISARIGMTKGAVYWHFKDKTDLLVDLIKRHLQEKCKRLGEKQHLPETLAELREFFLKEAQYVESNPNLQKFIFFATMQVEWSDEIFNRVIAKLGEIRNFHMTTILNALTSAQKKGEISTSADVREFAWMIANSWRGALDTYVADCNKEFSLSKNFICVLDIILDRLKREEK